MARKATMDNNFIPSEEDIKKLHEKLGINDEEEDLIEEENKVELIEEVEEEKEEEEVKKEPVKKKSGAKKSTNSSKKSYSPLDVIDKIEVDLNNLILNDDKNELEMIEDFEFVLNDKPTYQVVLNQSCYIAHMQGLRLADINMINSSTGGAFETQQRIYQVLHKMINSSSIGKMDFKTFLKVTSYFDLPTLFFGTYVETFPGKTDFTVTCRNCHQKIDVSIDNESFISVKDEEVYDHMQNIISSVKTPKQALEKSLVNKFERKMLPKSKIILEIQTPTLNDHLNLLASIKEDKIDEIRSLLMTLLFVKKIYFPDIKEIQKQGKPVYFPIVKRNEIYKIITDLQPDDIKELGNSIDKYINKYLVEYKIKSFKCTNCHEEVGDIDVDIEQLLFQELLQL